VKGSDLLGQERSLLSLADGSLGEEFTASESILTSSDGDKTPLGDRNEQVRCIDMNRDK
jgi:hypothetical protein